MQVDLCPKLNVIISTIRYKQNSHKLITLTGVKLKFEYTKTTYRVVVLALFCCGPAVKLWKRRRSEHHSKFD
jgi:hypothetical protein